MMDLYSHVLPNTKQQEIYTPIRTPIYTSISIKPE